MTWCQSAFRSGRKEPTEGSGGKQTWHGIKDIVIHFVQEEYDHQENRQAAYASFKNAQCQKCHRNLLYIPNKGMNSDFERASGCFYCHGTVVKMKDGRLDPETWPNVGVGRLNMDGSKGK